MSTSRSEARSETRSETRSEYNFAFFQLFLYLADFIAIYFLFSLHFFLDNQSEWVYCVINMKDERPERGQTPAGGTGERED